MCTVIVRVPSSPSQPTRILAVRDEDPGRPWNPLGHWWPDTHSGVVGVRDARAGGAWLAADPATHRFAVLLNRADATDRPESEIRSRGALVLDSVAGHSPGEPPPTHGFNLVEVDRGRARVVTWDGRDLRVVALDPGTHMVAHDDVDDPSTPRVSRWLGEFEASTLADDGEWWAPWIDILEGSSALSSTDDRAIIRDNRPLGYPTLSLLVCVASLTASGIAVHYGELDRPGEWGGLELR